MVSLCSSTTENFVRTWYTCGYTPCDGTFTRRPTHFTRTQNWMHAMQQVINFHLNESKLKREWATLVISLESSRADFHSWNDTKLHTIERRRKKERWENNNKLIFSHLFFSSYRNETSSSECSELNSMKRRMPENRTVFHPVFFPFLLLSIGLKTKTTRESERTISFLWIVELWKFGWGVRRHPAACALRI